jgi:hypothetical protein
LKKCRPRLSQNGAPGFVGHAAHLGDDLVAEQLRELGDEQHPRLGQHAAVEAAAVVGVQEQRAQLELPVRSLARNSVGISR